MATETTISIYGNPPLSEQEQARVSSIEYVQNAKIFLLKSLDKSNDTEVNEGIELILKLDKIEKKINQL